jgi:hypothetical protein
MVLQYFIPSIPLTFQPTDSFLSHSQNHSHTDLDVIDAQALTNVPTRTHPIQTQAKNNISRPRHFTDSIMQCR